MKQFFKIILGISVILASIILINKVLLYVLVDNAEDEVRYAMHELYEQNNIETLFLGSSHVMFGYIPQILEDGLEENIWLATSPVQRIDGSYHLLKEVLKTNDVKKVYVDMYYRQYRDIPEKRDEEILQYIWCISDYMKFGWNKIEFLLNASSKDKYINSFFVPSRYGNYLLDLKRFERVVKSKRSEQYRENKGPERFYKGTTTVAGEGGNPEMTSLIGPYDLARIENNIISEYSLKCLNKMVDLCKENNIELVLVKTPLTYFHLAGMEDYTGFYEYFKQYADEKGIEYVDFNLCKNDILPLEDEDFLDIHHLSGKGAEKYSKVFVDVMTNYDKQGREKLFYANVEEKIADLPQQTFGIVYEPIDETLNTYEVRIVSNFPVDVEYQIILLDEDENEIELIQDFEENNILKRIENATNCYKVVIRDKHTHVIYEEGNVYL